MKIATIIGVRPEIIKLSQLIPLLDKKFEHTLIFSGQHFSSSMVNIFFEELGIRYPDIFLKTKSSEQNFLIEEIKKSIKNKSFDAAIVYGDSNTTYAGALASKINNLKVIHIEAGLRSFNINMPEERNRIETDKISDILFPPTKLSENFLEKENIDNNIFVVGNTIVDACKKYEKKIDKSKIYEKLNLNEDFILTTVHRQENVDLEKNLIKLIKTFKGIKEKIVFPVHPRTMNRIKQFGLKLPENVLITEPLGYFDFLYLLKNAFLVLTDSGGVQEESIVLHTPCITLRNDTERWETVIAGGNVLTGLNPELIYYYVKMISEEGFDKEMRNAKNPYGEGDTSKKIQKILVNIL